MKDFFPLSIDSYREGSQKELLPMKVYPFIKK